MTGIAAVVPNRDGGALLERCLDALAAADAVEQIVVVDDGSGDGSPERAAERPRVHVVPSPGRGFAAAVNAGVAVAKSEWLLVLNNDCFVAPDAAARLREALKRDPGLAVCAAALSREDGSRAKTFDRQLTMYRALREAASLHLPPLVGGQGIASVPFVPLACALVRSEAWKSVGGLDTRYRFYFEDHDLCWRLARDGWRLAVDWDARAVHLEGGSSRRRDPQTWFVQFHDSRLRYLRKRYPRSWVVYVAIWVPSALVHAAVWLIRGSRSDREAARAWAQAYARAAVAGLR
jgi:N-acetylglucosaminyl-diphospho-decaprenol L-rhamnosyltransferase